MSLQRFVAEAGAFQMTRVGHDTPGGSSCYSSGCGEQIARIDMKAKSSPTRPREHRRSCRLLVIIALQLSYFTSADAAAQVNNTQKKFCGHIGLIHDDGANAYQSLTESRPLSRETDATGAVYSRYATNRPLFNYAECEVFKSELPNDGHTSVFACNMIAGEFVLDESAASVVERFREKIERCFFLRGIKTKAEAPRYDSWADQAKSGLLSQRICQEDGWILISAGAVGGALSSTHNASQADYHRHRLNTLQVSFGDHSCQRADVLATQ